jgi:hypothetical protein
LILVSPALVFGFVISSLYGVAFYLLFGRGWVRLWTYWVIGIAGFAVGQWVGGLIGLSALNIGAVNLLEATAISWISLFGVRALRR